MSYSSDVRDELAALPIARDCDAAAELAALVVCAGTLRSSLGSVGLKLELADGRVIERAAQLIGRLCPGAETTMTVSTGFRKTPLYALRLPEDVTAKLLSRCFDYTGGLFFSRVPKGALIRKRCCKQAFLRGAYLGGGVILDPKSSYHMEFAVSDRAFADCLLKTLADMGIAAKELLRGEAIVIYTKSGEAIADFLAAAGAVRMRLELENLRIIKESRNTANRVVNCDSANLDRTVEAAARQIEAIEYIRLHGGLEQLPERLFSTAEARINNPEAPLSELAEMLEVSRSGLNHRLDKLLYIAEELMEQNGDW